MNCLVPLLLFLFEPVDTNFFGRVRAVITLAVSASALRLRSQNNFFINILLKFSNQVFAIFIIFENYVRYLLVNAVAVLF